MSTQKHAHEFIHLSQKLETKCPPTGERIDNVIYPYNGILLSNKKKWNTDTKYNMNKPQKHHAK